MKQKKIIIGIVVIFILIIIGIIIGVFINESKYRYKIEEITEYQYNLLYIDEKYGVINKKGDVIIQPEYDIVQIPNPQEPVFICMKDFQEDKKEYKTNVLNENGNEILENFEKIETITLKEEDKVVPYEKSVLKYKQNDKYGLIDYNGKIKLEAKYDEIQGMPYKEGILIVRDNGKYGVINIKGTVLIPPIYDSINFDGYYNEETKYENSGFIVSRIEKEKELYGYHNARGKKIFDTQYDEINRIIETNETKKALLIVWKNGKAGIYQDNKPKTDMMYDGIDYDRLSKLYIISKDGKQGIMNSQGKEILHTEYDNIFISGECITAQKGEKLEKFDVNGNKTENENIIAKWKTDKEDLQIVMDVNERYGVQDKAGNSIIKNKYLSLEHLNKDYFIAMDEGRKVGVVETNGKSVVELKYDSINRIEDTNLIKAIKNDESKIDIYGEDMNYLTSFDGIELETDNFKDYVRMYTDGNNVKYYSKQGKKLEYKDIFPNAEMYSKQRDGKWGFVDKDGNLKVDYDYEEVTELNEYGYAGIKKDNKWGIVNAKGQIVQEPIYEIEDIIPDFLGKYYKVPSIISQSYYTNFTNIDNNEK